MSVFSLWERRTKGWVCRSCTREKIRCVEISQLVGIGKMCLLVQTTVAMALGDDGRWDRVELLEYGVREVLKDIIGLSLEL